MTASRLEQLRQLAAAQPHDAFAQYGLGLELLSEEDWLAALEAFRVTLAIDPNYAAAYHQQARALVKLNRPDDARDALTAGIAAAERQGDRHLADNLKELLETLG